VKTYILKEKDIEKNWYLIDANDKILGRVASKVAHILRGKHKPYYTPYIDMGDNIVIINADKIKLTGSKASKKKYYRHSGYPGGIKEISYLDMHKKNPTFALKNAIKGMLPKGSLGRKQLLHLKVYAGEDHPHQAQKPVKLDI